MARNEVTLEGFVRKIDLRYTGSGTAVLNLKVPIDRRAKNKDTGEWETVNTTWWQLTTWQEDAEFQAEHLQEGSLIQFTGMPEMEQQEGRDGKKYFNAVMKWPKIALLLRAPREKQQGAPSGGRARQDTWSQPGGQGSYDWGTDGQDSPPPF